MKGSNVLHILLCAAVILGFTLTSSKAQIPPCQLLSQTDPCILYYPPAYPLPLGKLSACELTYINPIIQAQNLFVWQGTIDNNWLNPGNWLTGIVPGPLNSVWIPSGLVNYPTIPPGAQAFCDSIWIRDGASILGNAALQIFGLAFVERYVNHLDWPHFRHCNWLDDSLMMNRPCDIHYLSSPVPDAKDSTVEQDAVWDWYETSQWWKWKHHMCSEPCLGPNWIWTPGTGYSVAANHYWWCNTIDCPIYNFPPGLCAAPWKCQFYREWIGHDLNHSEIEYIYSKPDTTVPPNLPQLTYTVPPPGQYPPGWHLLGNPYPSAINWFACWTNNVFINSACMWDDFAQVYRYVIGYNGFIPIIQGFMVQAMPGGGWVAFTEASRLHNNNVPLWKDERANFLKMKVTDENMSYNDETYVLINPMGENGIDMYDASKLGNGLAAPMIYSVLPDNTSLAVNTIQSSESNPQIPIHFRAGSEGTHTLTADGIDSFDPTVPLFLEDQYTGAFQDLRSNPVYTFEASMNDATGRFILHFTPLGVNQYRFGNINIYSFEQTVYMDIPAKMEARMFIYDMLGKKVQEEELCPGRLNRFMVTSGPGYYVAQVVHKGGVTTQKVFIH